MLAHPLYWCFETARVTPIKLAYWLDGSIPSGEKSLFLIVSNHYTSTTSIRLVSTMSITSLTVTHHTFADFSLANFKFPYYASFSRPWPPRQSIHSDLVKTRLFSA